MNKTNKNGVGLIYARYILPIAADIILIILMSLPLVRYSLNSELKEKMSLWGLVSNTWNNSRLYLFSTGSTINAEGKMFYTTVFVALIICLLLFIIGVAVNIFTLLCAGSVYASKNGRKSDGNIKNLYLTFIPNRVVYVILRGTVRPLAFFPYLLVFFYRRLLLYMVSVSANALIVGGGALILFVATAIVTAASKRFELRFDMNIFSKRKSAVSTEYDERKEDLPNDPDEYKIYQMRKASKDEQTERLRKLLGFDEEDK